MSKKNLLLVILLISVLVLSAACTKNKNPEPVQRPELQAEPANYDNQQTDFNNENGMMNPEDEQQPNAMDYMAPGHKQARERLKHIQELRQQALDAQRQDMEKMNIR